MRLNHLDILEQCFRSKIFGYNNEDVDTFLHLVSDDFKEISEELELLYEKLTLANQEIENLKEEAAKNSKNTKDVAPSITPEIIKDKAKRIINAARELANQHKKKAENELSVLKREIEKIKEEKKALADAHK